MSSTQSEPPESARKPSIAIFVWLIAVVTSLWALTPVVFHFVGATRADQGLIGDSFGAVNSLFSGLALAGVIYAIVLQRHELQMQREELENSRRELAAQNALISAQLATMQESWSFEKHKATQGARPLIVGKGGSSGPSKKECRFANYGAQITDLEVRVRGVARYNLHPLKVLERDATGTLTLEFDGPKSDVVVGIDFTDGLGHRQTLHFGIAAESLEWTPVDG